MQAKKAKMIRQFELVEKVTSYAKNADVDALNRAYIFALKAHGAQQRASGEPYFTHPLEVANILADLHLDSASIITGLLHDTVEDTGVTLADITQYFGTEVASLVDGVTKLSRLKHLTDAENQAENFRKLLLAMSEDIRVLLVKLADRLHNMRTLHHVKNPDKRLKTAHETMDIYAPLAERIGLHAFKDELEDFAFAEINPDARDAILARLHFLRRAGNALVDDVSTELQAKLINGDVDANISGREKKPYSIWRKMCRQNIPFEQLTDIVAFRIIVPTVKDCYKALWLIHSTYSVIPNKFKDYISTPKPNGYQSLHTAVFGPKRRRIEIQIRTEKMHVISENGVAAHWTYKQGAHKPAASAQQYQWLRGLLDILDQDSEPKAFLDHTKMEMFKDQVFCFSPKGDLIVLPDRATPVDFAYAIHSDVGNHCASAKINGKIVPLRTPLKTGDQVEILTSPEQTPAAEWDRFIVTGKARSHINKFLSQASDTQYQTLGRHMLEKALQLEGLGFSEDILTTLLPTLKIKTLPLLFQSLGQGMHSPLPIISLLLKHSESVITPKKDTPYNPKDFVAQEQKGLRRDSLRNIEDLVQRAAQRENHPESQNLAQGSNPENDPDAIPLKGLIPGMAIQFATCCHPIAGDKIVGIVSKGNGVSVHCLHCSVLRAFDDDPDCWLDVSWGPHHPDKTYVARIMVFLMNKPGSLADLTHIIHTHNNNIHDFTMMNKEKDFYQAMVDINVTDDKNLENLIVSLRSSDYITGVERL